MSLHEKLIGKRMVKQQCSVNYIKLLADTSM